MFEVKHFAGPLEPEAFKALWNDPNPTFAKITETFKSCTGGTVTWWSWSDADEGIALTEYRQQ